MADAAVRAAFRDLTATDPTGSDLVNVQAGAGLAAFQAGPVTPLVRQRPGRAVVVADGWLIERQTMADLLGLAGVWLPPPA